ncbi:putative RING-H2 finger protein ATL62 [Magnolia sinica]|uniref:putative RING-H2 finger protein ATL62 n=1 Tax=Magnolia sinica TaxID=86752 RepID=UPI002658A614|nr:putative RING-H2 finger protein ATL62 [Magnolia sinica]
MFGSGMNLITTVIGFGMSVTFIIFICTRLICGRIRSVDSRAATPAFETELRFEREHVINGLEPVDVAALPTMKFDREAFPSREDAQCSICLGEYEDREILRIMPTCGHNFHLTCIDTWLQKQSTCPVCRLSLQDSFEDKHMISPISNTTLQSLESPEVASDRSYQWLLPNQERSSGSVSNQEQRGPVAQNSESIHAREVQMR